MQLTRRDHDDVLARQQRGGRRVAQLLDLLVDRGVLLDEGVGRRDVRLGLVVVVVADTKYTTALSGRKSRELGGELRGERLVRRHDERRLLDRLDDLGHREGLARAGHAEKRLVAQALARRRARGPRSPWAGRRRARTARRPRNGLADPARSGPAERSTCWR